MGYKLENARNGKNASKIPIWPSLRPLELKSKFIQHFEFSENLEDLYRNVAVEQGLALQQLFSYRSSYFFQKFRPS